MASSPVRAAVTAGDSPALTRQAGVGLVDADSDRADDARFAQFVERLEAGVHHRLEALVEEGAVLDGPEIDVVHQHDVDARDPEPQM